MPAMAADNREVARCRDLEPMLRRLAILLLALATVALLALRTPVASRHATALGAFGRGPTVVLVHGLGSSASDWLPMARDLARDHRVVLVELPGHGIAPMLDGLSLEGAAGALDDAIRSECDGPVVLVGHSVGGLVAAAEALRDPDRVRALVLVETALRPQLDSPARAELFAALDHDYRGTLRESYMAFGRDSAQGAALFAEASNLDPAAMKTWIRLATTTDLSGHVAALRAPLLVVLSSRSWPDGEAWRTCADTLGYAAVPGATPVRIERTGHFVMLDRAPLLADVIRRFEHDLAPPAFAVLAR
jgi:pimeloyl-ACP methyl ester carboxylesterase